MRLRWARVAVLLLVACGGDPVLDPIEASLTAYDAGRAALATDQPLVAAAAFAQASEAAPDQPLPVAWRAHALVQAGDLQGAFGVLDAGLTRWPGQPDLAYQRAALRARLGDLKGAAADLVDVYQSGAVLPQDAALDPDFAPLLAQPDTAALLPLPTVDVQVTGEAGAVLLGESWDLDLLLSLPAGAHLSLEDRSEAPGLLRLVSVVEDQLGVEGRVEGRRVVLHYEAARPGLSQAGPWRVVAGAAETLVPARPVEVLALGQRAQTQPDGPGRPLPVPSALGPADPAPRLERLEPWTVLTAPASAKTTWMDATGQPLDPLRVELRESGRSLLIRELLPGSPAVHVRVEQAGLVLLEAQLP